MKPVNDVQTLDDPQTVEAPADPSLATEPSTPTVVVGQVTKITPGRLRKIEDHIKRAIGESGKAIEAMAELLANRDETVQSNAVDGVRHAHVITTRLQNDLVTARVGIAETTVIARTAL